MKTSQIVSTKVYCNWPYILFTKPVDLADYVRVRNSTVSHSVPFRIFWSIAKIMFCSRCNVVKHFISRYLNKKSHMFNKTSSEIQRIKRSALGTGSSIFTYV